MFEATAASHDDNEGDGELRVTVGAHVAILANIYRLVVEGELSEMLPVKVLDRDV